MKRIIVDVKKAGGKIHSKGLSVVLASFITRRYHFLKYVGLIKKGKR